MEENSLASFFVSIFSMAGLIVAVENRMYMLTKTGRCRFWRSGTILMPMLSNFLSASFLDPMESSVSLDQEEMHSSLCV